MAEKQVGLNIDVADLQALAQINPLAWEQLLHIADVRALNERITELESENDRLTTRAVNLFNGHEKTGLSDSHTAVKDENASLSTSTNGSQDLGIVP